MANPNAIPPEGFDKHPERINKEGRPRKWVSQLKEQGYKKSEVIDAINVLISMDAKELKEVAANDKATALEKIVALSLLESIRKKTPYNIELFLTRVYGQPKQEIDASVSITKFDVKFNDGDNLPKE